LTKNIFNSAVFFALLPENSSNMTERKKMYAGFFQLTFKVSFVVLLSFFAFSFQSCKGNEPKKGDSGEEANQKSKKKPKKCKLEECHVRMSHYHEGKLVKGKRGGFFTTLFAPKDPLYGQSVPKYNRRRDPAQGKRKW
jgi:hypothetical protein